MVLVHALMVAGTCLEPKLARYWAASWPSRVEHRGVSSNVVGAQPGYLARPTTKAPETQIYCTNHRSGAFPWLRQRTVARGERASRSIVNRTTALWSIWVVASLIVAGLGSGLVYTETWGARIRRFAALMEHRTYLDLCPSGLDGLYH